jgi:hypothetical protein
MKSIIFKQKRVFGKSDDIISRKNMVTCTNADEIGENFTTEEVTKMHNKILGQKTNFSSKNKAVEALWSLVESSDSVAKLKKRETCITKLTYLLENGSYTLDQLSELTGYPKSTVICSMTIMKNNGFTIERRYHAG